MKLSWHHHNARRSKSLGQASIVNRDAGSAGRDRHREDLHGIRKVACGFCVLLMTTTVWAQQAGSDLTMRSLEDLMNIEVTSVSKKEERLYQTAAAVYVVTQQDIRRSGLTSIPELLRMVPGLDVARIDGNKWATSAG